MRKKNKLGYKWILLLLAFSCGSRIHAQYTLQISNNKTGQSIEKVEVRNAIDNASIGQSDINGNNRLIIGNNEWQHFTATYDAISSKFLVYINGKLQAMTDDVSNRFGDDPANGGGPLGPLKFKGATRFVFGCYNNHLPGNTPDPWMKHFDGGLDEFRIYNKALSSSDVESLHDLEKQGK